MGVKESVSEWPFVVGLCALPICAIACASPTRLNDSPPTPLNGPVEMPSRDAMGLFMEAAQRPCADLARTHANQTVAADVMVSGTSNGTRVSSRLWLGWDFDAGWLRLEPSETWPPAFVFIAIGLIDDRHDPEVDGNLVLPDALPQQGASRQQRSRELLYPLLGVPLSTRELTSVIAGCTSFGGSLTGFRLGPDRVRLLFDDDLPAELLFGRDADVPAGWSLLGMSRSIAGSTAHWRADYGRRVLALFKDFRIHSREWTGAIGGTFDVSFSWRRIQIGLPLDKNLFAVDAPSPRPDSWR